MENHGGKSIEKEGSKGPSSQKRWEESGTTEREKNKQNKREKKT